MPNSTKFLRKKICVGVLPMNGTPRGTATLVITGTSNGLSHSASVTLTVQ